MTDLHIDDFCKDCAKILLSLYAKFPQKIILYVEDISGPDKPDEFGLHSPRHQACFSAMNWLAETDYISYIQPIRQEALEGVTLTHRAFTFLTSAKQAPAEPTDTQESSNVFTRIEILRETLKDGSSDKLTSLILSYFNDSRSFR